MRMKSKSESGCHCAPRFPVLQRVLSVVQSTRPQEDTVLYAVNGHRFQCSAPVPSAGHAAMRGVFKGTCEEADSASLCSSLQESDDDIFSCDGAESLDSVSLSTPGHLPVSIWSRISCFLASTSFFGWFVLGGFSLLHLRNSASKFFYHTNASESIMLFH